MEIIQERLEREFDMTVITTVPNVSYHAYLTREKETPIIVNNPIDFPDPSMIHRMEEPYIKASIITKSDYVGPIMSLAIEKRGELTNQVYLTTDRVELNFNVPLAEIVFDFYDRLKSISRGYASFDYHPIGFRESHLVKMDIMLNGDMVDALSALVHKDNAYDLGKKICLIERNKPGGAGIFNGALSSKTMWELSNKVKTVKDEIGEDKRIDIPFSRVKEIIDEALFERKFQLSCHLRIIHAETSLINYEKGTAIIGPCHFKATNSCE